MQPRDTDSELTLPGARSGEGTRSILAYLADTLRGRPKPSGLPSDLLTGDESTLPMDPRDLPAP